MIRTRTTLCALALAATIAGGAVAAPAGTQSDKVTLCHATGSAKNPFVTITIAAPAAYAHTRHQDGRDIIPPFTHRGVVYSQNWDSAGQAVHANDCVAPSTGGGGGGGNGEFARKATRTKKQKRSR